MNNLDLNTISEVHLTGKWKIQANNAINYNDSDFFAHQREIEILPSGIFKASNDRLVIGTWSMERQNVLFHYPQLRFYLHREEIANAIVTKVYVTQEDGKDDEKVVLYFKTGLQIILTKI